ncbi:MAG: hypothetical protein OQK12_15535 [Motiliproteus sp.]|nr:hypothetical protein [Motiliproteus sp.]MCW9052382.1 hypothetical protein [Motiliproteus sp.]
MLNYFRKTYYILRKLYILILAYQPSNGLRSFFYNILDGYEIKNSKIGWGTVINVHKFKVCNSSIGKRNKFLGPMLVDINDNSIIGNMNQFICGDWVSSSSATPPFKRSLVLERKSWITGEHYFDIAGMIKIEEKSTIAGRRSEFWTHGVGASDRDIIIGGNSYIGSGCKFAPGSSICNGTLVQIGTIITQKFKEQNVIIAGEKSKIVKRNSTWKTKFEHIKN